MDMMMSPPTWLTIASWVAIVAAVASAAILAVRIAGRGGRPSTMDVVWPLSALYLGPLAVWLRGRWGRRDMPPTVATGLAGGAASSVAHLIGVPLVVASGVTIAGIDLWPMILVIAVLATVLLALFEASAGWPVGRAVLIAAVTVLAFDVGMGGWMLLLHFSAAMPAASTVAFWFLMQLGVVLGTLTALPVVRSIVARA